MSPSVSATPRAVRLTPGQTDLAQQTFAVMAEVFGEGSEPLSDAYVDDLLTRESFWAIAAFVGEELVGGLTAHTLPMTRAPSSEIFIYDLAVLEAYQRRGVGRALVGHLREIAAQAGIPDVFVPADDEDLHALDFYRALGGEAAPVTIFTFSAGPDDR